MDVKQQTKTHDLFMGEGYPEDQAAWDRSLSTKQMLEQVNTQLDNESDGDELTIIVRTHKP